jgi:hypothetical protein
MSVFFLPKGVIRAIDKVHNNFFWHGAELEKKRKIHLVNLDVMCMLRSLRGLGIIDLKIFNIALMEKWLWKWVEHDHPLWKELNLVLQIHVREWALRPFLPFRKEMRRI